MDLLARREHSRRELERKLVQREFEPALVARVLDELIDEGLLDNQRFAEAFVRSRIVRGKGPLKILAELSERGVGQAQAEQALAASETDWAAVAEEALAKRFGAEPINDVKERARRTRFLAARGFSGAQASAALRRSQQGQMAQDKSLADTLADDNYD